MDLLLITFFSTRDVIASLGLDEILVFIRNDAIDRDAWEMADQGLMILHNIKPLHNKVDMTGKKLL